MNSQSFFAGARNKLSVLAAGPTDLVEVAQTAPAAWHPNGFIVFSLGDTEHGALRLHIWPAGARPTRDEAANVHTHVWDLCSLVLAGTYAERNYFKATPNTGEIFTSALVDYANDPDTLIPTKESNLTPGPLMRFEPGEFHFVEAGVAHETLIPESSYVATLLITSVPHLSTASVYSRTPALSGGHTRPVVEESLKSDLLNELRQKLEDEG